MLKGTSQSKRNSAWHKRHLIKRTRRAKVHAFNMATLKRESDYRTAQTDINTRKAYKVADKHKANKLSLWGRFIAFIKNLIHRPQWQT